MGIFYAAVHDGDMRLLFGGTDPGEVLALFALGILANALPLVIHIEPFRRLGIEGRVLPDAIAVVATLLSALALRNLPQRHDAGIIFALSCVILDACQTCASEASARSAKLGKA